MLKKLKNILILKMLIGKKYIEVYDFENNIVYEKKIKPPNFIDYMKNSIKYYNKPKLFANDDFLNKTDEHNTPNMLKGWSFINQD